MQRIAARWAPARNGVDSANYTLSLGLSPSTITLQCFHFTGEIPAVSDVVFTDGERTLTFKDCLYNEKGAQNSGSGRLRTVTLFDRRWRWKFGVMEGRYNRMINEHPELQLLSAADRPSGYEAETKSARDLATECLRIMGEVGYDVEALPADDFPVTEWDFCTPAQALGELCDRYHLVVAFDPCTCKVTLCEKGDGADLPFGAGMLSDDLSSIQAPKPKTLRAVCGYTEHEVEFDLEAVGLDVDGSVKDLDHLTYKPAGGWSAEFLDFEDLSDALIPDPNPLDLPQSSARRLAKESIYRWYRIVPKAITNWTEPGWGTPSSLPTLAQLLPISGKLVKTITATDAQGNTDARRRPAYVTGVYCPDPTLGSAGVETAAGTLCNVKFSLDERAGIVKFSEPVISLNGSGAPIPAVLKFRCVVFADRYTKDQDIGGAYGIETVQCEGYVLQYVHGTDPDTGLETLDSQINNLDAQLKAILQSKADSYEIGDNGSRVYAGVQQFQLDGRIQQITWQVGSGGATTTASVNSEHSPWVAPAGVRRQAERNAVKSFTPAPTGIPGGGEIGGPAYMDPRHFGASNAYAGEVPAYSLVKVTAISGRLATVTRPGADGLITVMATGISPIPQSGTGICSADWPLPVKYAGAAPSVDDERGTAANSFELTAGKTGFKVMAVDVGAGVAWVVPAGGGGGAKWKANP